MIDNKNSKNRILNSFSKKEIIVWETILYLRGLVLRGQLLTILKLIYDMDEIAASKAISKLKEKNLIESRAAMPGCNAVMIRLTRKGKALMDNKATKEVSLITDTPTNNLRCIFMIENFIVWLKKETKQEREVKMKNYKRFSAYISKNNYKENYKFCRRTLGDAFKMPDLDFDNSKNREFNFYNMMCREFYFGDICEKDKKTIKVALFYYGVYELKNEFKIINFEKNVKSIYDMFKNYLYRKWKGNMNLEINFIVILFDENECKYFNKKINHKRISEIPGIYPDDKILINTIDASLDRKYKLRRELK